MSFQKGATENHGILRPSPWPSSWVPSTTCPSGQLLLAHPQDTEIPTKDSRLCIFLQLEVLLQIKLESASLKSPPIGHACTSWAPTGHLCSPAALLLAGERFKIKDHSPPPPFNTQRTDRAGFFSQFFSLFSSRVLETLITGWWKSQVMAHFALWRVGKTVCRWPLLYVFKN